MTQEPLVKSIRVRCTAEHAFRVWTRHTSLWWPEGHRPSGDPDSVIVWEEHEGGRVFERATSGEEHDWGRVIRWGPPRELGFDFFFGHGAEAATRVTVRFAEEGDGTRVDLLHEAGALPLDLWSGFQGKFDHGWRVLLPRFVERAPGISQNANQ